MYVIGGSNGETLLGDVYKLHVDKLHWEAVAVAFSGDRNVFTARARHTAVLHNNCIYVFGGIGGASDVFVLNLMKQRWIRAACTGQIPEPRFGHSASALNGKMFVVGGSDLVRMFEQVYFLDLESLVWVRVRVAGVLRPDIHLNSCLFSNRDNLFLFDDSKDELECMWHLVPDSETFLECSWQTIQITGIGPSLCSTIIVGSLSIGSLALQFNSQHIYIPEIKNSRLVLWGLNLKYDMSGRLHGETPLHWHAESFLGEDIHHHVGATIVASNVYSDQLFLLHFAGTVNDLPGFKYTRQDLVTDDLLLIDKSSRLPWELLPCKLSESRMNFTFSFAGVVDGKQRFVVLGGEKGSQLTIEDYVLEQDLSTLEWKRVPITMYLKKRENRSVLLSSVVKLEQFRTSSTQLEVSEVADEKDSLPSAYPDDEEIDSYQFPPMAGHSCNTISQLQLHGLFVFGGGNLQGDLFNDIWILNTSSWSWKQVIKPTLNLSKLKDFFGTSIRGDNKDLQSWPCGRIGHCSVNTSDGIAFISGGYSKNPKTGQPELMNDVWQVDAASLLASDSARWILWEEHSILTPRFGHSGCVFDADEKCLLFGGAVGGVERQGFSPHQGLQLSNELFVLDLHTRSVTISTAVGTYPSPRYQHSSCQWEGKMCIYAGFGIENHQEKKGFLSDIFILDTLSNVWSHPRLNHVNISSAMVSLNASASKLLPRRSHRSTYDSFSRSILVFGGETSPEIGEDFPFRISLIPSFDRMMSILEKT